MTTGDSIEQRGRTLEDAFFHRVDQQLLQQLKQHASVEQGRQALASACPWASDAMLDSLEHAKITPESLVSLTLVPLIRVAWADGRIELKEREAILKAASDFNCAEDSPGHKFLAAWLDEPAEAEKLFESWKHYATALVAAVPAESASALKAQIVEHARGVAKATGGILGIHSISDAEEAVLKEIEAAFD